MPSHRVINGLKKPYNRVFLASLRATPSVDEGSDRANNDHSEIFQRFLA